MKKLLFAAMFIYSASNAQTTINDYSFSKGSLFHYFPFYIQGNGTAYNKFIALELLADSSFSITIDNRIHKISSLNAVYFTLFACHNWTKDSIYYLALKKSKEYIK